MWTLDFLSRVLSSIAVIDADAAVEDSADALGDYMVFAAAIGRRLGELHAVLAGPSDAPDFAPEEAADGDAAAWGTAVRTQLDAAYTVLAGRAEWPDDDSREAAVALQQARGALNAAVGRLAAAAPGWKIESRVLGEWSDLMLLNEGSKA